MAVLFLGACAHTRECRDCPIMVTIPAGVAALGAPESDELRNRDEGPFLSVKISKPFAVSKFEITRSQYAALK